MSESENATATCQCGCRSCAYEGFDFIGIDQSAEYVEIAQARIAWAKENV